MRTNRGRKRGKAVVERRRFRIPGAPLLAETSVARFPPGRENRAGVKYRLQLYHEASGETLVRYDIHHGKDHHRHVLGEESLYVWRGVETLFRDFRRDVERVKSMLEGGAP